MQAAQFSVAERLPGGKFIEIRALRPEDRHGLLAALYRSSDQSRYRRFFSPKRGFTESERRRCCDENATRNCVELWRITLHRWQGRIPRANEKYHHYCYWQSSRLIRGHEEAKKIWQSK